MLYFLFEHDQPTSSNICPIFAVNNYTLNDVLVIHFEYKNICNYDTYSV